MISYPGWDAQPKELQNLVNGVLGNILTEVNQYMSKNNKDKDPLAFAAKMQRTVVALHAFSKGNGRTSRWIMDYITTSLNLPPILVPNMDLDLSTSEKKYEKQSHVGATESLDRMEACLKLYKDTKDVSSLQGGPCGLLQPVSTLGPAPECKK